MKTKKCVDCGKTFTLSDSELDFYKRKELSEPKRCKACREKKTEHKQENYSPVREVQRKGFFRSLTDRLFGAIGREYTFANESRLKEHYKKHRRETGCFTKRQYLKKANRVLHSPFALHKKDRQTGDSIYFLPTTGELVRLSAYQHIRTYYIATEDYFNRT